MVHEGDPACSIAKGCEVWEGEQQEEKEKEPSKPVVAKKGKKAKNKLERAVPMEKT